LGDDQIPDDVREKILRFVRAGLAVATMKGSSYLAVGGVSMGIAGSIVDNELFENYLGMRVESVDMTGSRAPYRQRDLRPNRVLESARMDEEALH
jgi:L-fucose isomerase